MNLDEFKKHVIAQREASKAQALSVLSATITKSTNERENLNGKNERIIHSDFRV